MKGRLIKKVQVQGNAADGPFSAACGYQSLEISSAV